MTLLSLLTLGAAQSWNVPLVLLLLKATLILIAALGITLAMQRTSAGARHLVWLVTLVALALIPALTAWGPLRLEILPAREIASAPPAQRQVISAGTNGQLVLSAPESSVPAASATATPPAAASDGGILASLRDASIGSLALGLWAVITFGILVSLTWSALVVRGIVRRSRTLDERSWLTPLYEVSDRLGLQEPPRLLLSHDAKMPFACGLATPTIVLPAECESWSQERRLAVLLHELAHVRRRDMIGHTLGRLVCAVYWFHPLVWTAARQLRAESERACDDLALACGTRATDYAEHLLDIVTSVRREGTPMVALAMARRKEFEGRMLAILDPELRHSTPSRGQSAMLIGTLAVISIVVGAAAPAPASARQAVAPDSSRVAIVTAPSAASKDADLNVANDRPAQERAIERAVERTVPRPKAQPREAAARSTSTQLVESKSESSVTKALSNAVTNLIVRVVPNAISTGLESGANALHVTAQDLLTKAPRGTQAADDRPILLAKVLRSDTSAALRRVAAWGLGEYADNTIAVEALAAAVRRDASESVREMAAWALGEGNDNGPSAGVDALVAALRDQSVGVRRTAAWALGNIGNRRALDPLIGALSDASPEVRTRAVWAIGNVGPKQAPRQLVAMLADKDENVRELTAWALYNIEDPEAASALQAALRVETNPDLQLKYIRALAVMGEKSVDAIRPLLESSDQRIKSMAVRALAGGHATGPWPHPWPQPRPYP